MHRLKRIITVLIVSFFTVLLSACTFFQSKSTFSIQFIDVGQGDAALVECDGHYMLIDGGPKGAGEKVRSALSERRIDHLNILAVSHIHDDHIGGLPKALTYATTIDLVLCPVDDSNSTTFNDFYNELTANDASITVPNIGDKYQLGDATVEVIESGKEKNECMILLITYGQTTFLFTGDMEHDQEIRLCDKYNDELEVSLLKVGHHGSRESTSIRFLNMVHPKYAVISVGDKNRYNHPDEQTISRLNQAEVTYYRTDIDGSIIVKSDGKNLTIETER